MTTGVRPSECTRARLVRNRTVSDGVVCESNKPLVLSLTPRDDDAPAPAPWTDDGWGGATTPKPTHGWAAPSKTPKSTLDPGLAPTLAPTLYPTPAPWVDGWAGDGHPGDGNKDGWAMPPAPKPTPSSRSSSSGSSKSGKTGGSGGGGSGSASSKSSKDVDASRKQISRAESELVFAAESKTSGGGGAGIVVPLAAAAAAAAVLL